MTNAAHIELLDAAENLGEALDSMTAIHVGPRLTCREADALAGMFEAAGDTNSAVNWIYGHAYGENAAEEADSGDRHCGIESEKAALAYVQMNL